MLLPESSRLSVNGREYLVLETPETSKSYATLRTQDEDGHCLAMIGWEQARCPICPSCKSSVLSVRKLHFDQLILANDGIESCATVMRRFVELAEARGFGVIVALYEGDRVGQDIARTAGFRAAHSLMTRKGRLFVFHQGNGKAH